MTRFPFQTDGSRCHIGRVEQGKEVTPARPAAEWGSEGVAEVEKQITGPRETSKLGPLGAGVHCWREGKGEQRITPQGECWKQLYTGHEVGFVPRGLTFWSGETGKRCRKR